ncbi:MAG: hypothetical protein HC915_00585 [Anaerolineae bacterium]|nr:hypothetical protein [Anaerolineae bacterium]
MWFYLRTESGEAVYDYALAEAERLHEAAWQAVAEWAGPELREGARLTGQEPPKTQALARLYSRHQLENALALPLRVLRLLLQQEKMEHRLCPDGVVRFRAQDVHQLRDNPARLQDVEDEFELTSHQLRLLTDLKLNYLRTHLHNAGVKPTGSRGQGHNETLWYRWGDVRQVFWPDGDHPNIADIELIEETGGSGRAWWSDQLTALHDEIEDKKRKRRDARDRRRQEMREQRAQLRAQMIDNFPSWLRDPEFEQTAFIHVGPTNSGKTHDALVELSKTESGWYLAPLRLLAREVFEKLNRMGVYCSLLTGEERIDVPGATFTAATVEMFNPLHSGDCVVVDEAHLVGDDQRGWAWTQALVRAEAPQLRVITAPHGLNLLTRIFENTGVETQVLHHQRMVPLEVADRPWDLSHLPPRTILVAFTRRDVLRLKYELQQMGRSVAVVYGALPPEVRLKQAERFARGEVEICVATDAVGMGLNLPADNVVFSTLRKFDGKQRRRLEASELQQIAGRAGRFGMSERGLVNGINKGILDEVRKLMNQPIPDVGAARLAPRTDEIELLEGDLVERLITWQKLNAIPDDLRGIVTSTEMDDRIELARFLSYEDLFKLGVDRALTLVNAPVRSESQEYWVECATAILEDTELPQPPPSLTRISEGASLKRAEAVIACIDIYLWLAYRQPFQHLVQDVQPIMLQREALIREMDLALMKKFDPNASRGRSGTWNEYF